MMSSQIILSYDERFFEDIKEILDWYDNVSKSLATKFLNKVELAETKILTNPYSFRKISKTHFRRILIPHFPFKMFYRIEKNTIIIIAIIHTARSNRFIKKRLK